MSERTRPARCFRAVAACGLALLLATAAGAASAGQQFRPMRVSAPANSLGRPLNANPGPHPSYGASAVSKLPSAGARSCMSGYYTGLLADYRFHCTAWR